MPTTTALPRGRTLSRQRLALLLALVALVAGAVAARANGTAPPPSRPFGPDVASYQHPHGAGVDWRAVKASGSSFAIIKSTEGTSYRNPYFAGDWSAARSAGLVRGTYHYARPALPLSSAVDQAAFFVRTAGTTVEPSALAPILDLEESGGLAPAQLVQWTQVWLDTVAQLTGRTPIIYTYPYFWPSAMGNTTAFGGYPLWIASYNAGTQPRYVPRGWSQWVFWQSTSTGSARGIIGQVDMSSFAGTAGDLAGFGSGLTGIQARVAQLGAAAPATLGSAQGGEVAIPGGRMQRFSQGAVYWTPRTGAHYVTGAMATRYAQLGGPGSLLGLPERDSQPVSGGEATVFYGGTMYAGPATGVHELHGAILARYTQLGAQGSKLGLPRTDVRPVSGGQRSDFMTGSISYSRSSGTTVSPAAFG